MASFGELVLVLGDMHIPSRASKIPAPFKRMLVPGRMQHVICTGNCPTNDAELQSLAPNLHFVAGDWDNDTSATYPESRVVQVGPFRIGVIHGHQIVPWKSHAALAATRRKLNVDILITGHTHQNSVVIEDDCCYINPGSITGATSTVTSDVVPSFVLLAVQEDKVVCYVYELKGNDVEVSKTEFAKVKKETVVSKDPALLDSLLQ
ncbi:uncharacterized protein FisN_6Lh283 [Fistulifera solaris]|uniref:Vacuolar protein sorting-associated protein 29 n=1 Tax=Fistulifera solaris TaxID=1519565 RepID=A0A1Z5J5T0_FISSO|nr:uncharacterized protein FisN_6Lh283 [Fistulifera solaris]|eukprot:GAX09347.1 uncharacterized protein FisN_6Lh283 [Fistulifera solaris]